MVAEPGGLLRRRVPWPGRRVLGSAPQRRGLRGARWLPSVRAASTFRGTRETTVRRVAVEVGVAGGGDRREAGRRRRAGRAGGLAGSGRGRGCGCGSGVPGGRSGRCGPGGRGFLLAGGGPGGRRAGGVGAGGRRGGGGPGGREYLLARGSLGNRCIGRMRERRVPAEFDLHIGSRCVRHRRRARADRRPVDRKPRRGLETRPSARMQPPGLRRAKPRQIGLQHPTASRYQCRRHPLMARISASDQP